MTNPTKQTSERVARFDKLPAEARLGIAEVGEILGRHRQSLWRYVRKGELPKPLRVMGGRPTWSVSQVRKAMEVTK